MSCCVLWLYGSVARCNHALVRPSGHSIDMCMPDGVV